MVVPTSGALIVDELQYDEETTFGTKVTSSPTYLAVGVTTNPEFSGGPETISVPITGDEDAHKLLLGKESYALKFSYKPVDILFSTYGVNSQGGGSTTIDKSLTMMLSGKMSGTTNYYFAHGCRVETMTFKGGPGRVHEIDVEMKCKQIPAPATSHGLSGQTLATAVSGTPWKFEDGGASPISWNSSGIDCTDITVRFQRNLKEIYAGDGTTARITYLHPTERKITGTMTVVHTAKTLLDDEIAGTLRTLAWVLKTGSGTLTLSNVKLDALSSLAMPESDVVFEKYNFTATTAALAA